MSRSRIGINMKPPSGDPVLDAKRAARREAKRAYRARKAAEQPAVRAKPGPRLAPLASTGPAETVEQFIARGGKVQQLPGIQFRGSA